MGPREKWESPEKIFFFRETQFHSVTTKTQAVVTIYHHCIIFLLPFNGKSMCTGLFASKLTENAVILRYNFSLSDSLLCYFRGGRSHFSLLSGPSLNPVNNYQAGSTLLAVSILGFKNQVHGLVMKSKHFT